eukprot:TRINITY_DN5504_c0_g1_i1.p1 TRINITY_DN5504_c0_g1~~TRINITY_DN5504_c0_g1_i1.p1  ORF type:complete len:125 (-),score=44.73 TRINITY_DN5504_c0_g1_i1:359-733(-)
MKFLFIFAVSLCLIVLSNAHGGHHEEAEEQRFEGFIQIRKDMTEVTSLMKFIDNEIKSDVHGKRFDGLFKVLRQKLYYGSVYRFHLNFFDKVAKQLMVEVWVPNKSGNPQITSAIWNNLPQVMH